MWSNLFIFVFLLSARPFQTGLNHPVQQTGSTGRQVCEGAWDRAGRQGQRDGSSTPGSGERRAVAGDLHLWGGVSKLAPVTSSCSCSPPQAGVSLLGHLLPHPADSNILVNVFCLWPHLTPSLPCAGLSWPTLQAGISLLPEEMGSSSGPASKTS